MENEIKVLILEDVLTDLELMLFVLIKAKIGLKHLHVESKESFIKGIREFNPDIILSDYNLPQFSGMEAIKLAKEASPLIPLIIVTGSLNEETAVDCIKAGASDYVLKDNLIRLAPAVKGAIENT